MEVLRAMADLLEDVPHVMFCAKDESGAYLTVNQAFADRAGARNPDEVVGRYAEDLFDDELATSYSRQDAELWASRQPLRNQLELIRRPDGTLGWYVHHEGPDQRRGWHVVSSQSVGGSPGSGRRADSTRRGGRRGGLRAGALHGARAGG